MRAPAGITSTESESEPGVKPRSRISSENEVSSKDFVIRFSLTKVPAP